MSTFYGGEQFLELEFYSGTGTIYTAPSGVIAEVYITDVQINSNVNVGGTGFSLNTNALISGRFVTAVSGVSGSNLTTPTYFLKSGESVSCSNPISIYVKEYKQP